MGGCPSSFQVGYTYRGSIASGTGDTGNGVVYFLLVDQGRQKVGTLQAPAVVGSPFFLGASSHPLTCSQPLSPPGGHWELIDNSVVCKAGRDEVMRWTPDDPSQRAANSASSRQSSSKVEKPGKHDKNLPRCINHPAHTNWQYAVVIKVLPAAGKHWNFDEAPSVVAQRFLQQLNNNDSRIKFIEPNGSYPDFDITVTLDETNDGTRRDKAWATVDGPYEVTTGTTRDTGQNFTENSGDAPYTSWNDAIDRLAQNTGRWFATGWHNNPPCIQSDGLVRRN